MAAGVGKIEKPAEGQTCAGRACAGRNPKPRGWRGEIASRERAFVPARRQRCGASREGRRGRPGWRGDDEHMAAAAADWCMETKG